MSADVHTEEQRSYNMSRIRGRDTVPELLLRKTLWAKGLRYRVKNTLPGRPDIVFPSSKLVVFIDGCFWHGCPRHMTWPKSNAQFWRSKIVKNIQRDKKVTADLKLKGWSPLRFWEHEITADVLAVADRISSALNERDWVKYRKP